MFKEVKELKEHLEDELNKMNYWGDSSNIVWLSKEQLEYLISILKDVK